MHSCSVLKTRKIIPRSIPTSLLEEKDGRVITLEPSPLPSSPPAPVSSSESAWVFFWYRPLGASDQYYRLIVKDKLCTTKQKTSVQLGVCWSLPLTLLQLVGAIRSQPYATTIQTLEIWILTAATTSVQHNDHHHYNDDHDDNNSSGNNNNHRTITPADDWRIIWETIATELQRSRTIQLHTIDVRGRYDSIPYWSQCCSSLFHTLHQTIVSIRLRMLDHTLLAPHWNNHDYAKLYADSYNFYVPIWQALIQCTLLKEFSIFNGPCMIAAVTTVSSSSSPVSSAQPHVPPLEPPPLFSVFWRQIVPRLHRLQLQTMILDTHTCYSILQCIEQYSVVPIFHHVQLLTLPQPLDTNSSSTPPAQQQQQHHQGYRHRHRIVPLYDTYHEPYMRFMVALHTWRLAVLEQKTVSSRVVPQQRYLHQPQPRTWLYRTNKAVAASSSSAAVTTTSCQRLYNHPNSHNDDVGNSTFHILVDAVVVVVRNWYRDTHLDSVWPGLIF
jgi:hypothetical protein